MKLQRLLPRGIRQKLLVSLSLLVLSIALFVFVLFRARLEQQAMSATLANAVAARDMTAYSLSAGLFFADTGAVKEVLDGAARGRDVAFLAVRDASGRPFAMIGSPSDVPATVPEIGYVTSDGTMYVTAAPITQGEKQIGTLTVGISLDALRREVSAARRLGAIVGAVVLLIGFVVVYVISWRVTSPLRAVSETVRGIAAGNLTLRAKETADTEVKDLVRAFNDLIDNLAGAQAELSQSNLQLEARVEARTAELSKAVHDEQRAQLALMESEAQARGTSEMLQSLIDVAPQAIVAVDRDWKVTRWNKTAERLVGWTEAEVRGRRFPCLSEDELLTLSARQPIDEHGGGSSASETALVRKAGGAVSVLLSIAAIHHQAEDAAGYICVATDLTGRHALEEQLRQAQKMDAIGRLAGGIAHDFNNILTVITSSAAMLLETPRSQDDQEDMQAILTSAVRAAALTRQLLLFSSKQPVALRSIDLTDVVNGMGPMLRRLLRANVHLNTICGSDGCFIVADPTQLEQVIMNLTVNASDAMPDGGTLTVETKLVEIGNGLELRLDDVPAGRYVVLTVSDTGTGIAPADMTTIFEPFFTTKDVGQGTGLGLATCYAVITRLKGYIRVESELRKGTAFRVYLPYEASLDGKPRAQLPGSEKVLTGTANILVVEDESSVRFVISRTLSRLGYSIVEAVDGESGLAVVRQAGTPIDLVITDVMMPGMNGHVFAERALKERPGLPIIFISGYTPSSVAEIASTATPHAFLQKPFKGEQLAEIVADVLHGDYVKPGRRALA